MSETLDPQLNEIRRRVRMIDIELTRLATAIGPALRWGPAETIRLHLDMAAQDMRAYVAALEGAPAQSASLAQLEAENARLKRKLAEALVQHDTARDDAHHHAAEVARLREAAAHYADATMSKQLDATEVALAERDAALAENARLRIALHDAICRPMGVTPDSALEFYDQRMANEAEERRPRMSDSPSPFRHRPTAPVRTEGEPQA